MTPRSCLSVLALLPALASDVFASSPDPLVSIQDRVREAELIVQGTVVGIETRLSDADAESPHPIPHTFVRYRVERVLKGAVEDGEITLRFLGGPVDSDRYVTMSGAPLFDVGDRDVLLARANLQADCPLVGCGAGRFRMVEDMLVSEEGRRLQLSDEGQILEGPAMKLDAINHTRMSDTIQLERIEVPENGEVILDPSDPAVRASFDPGRDFTAERFVGYLDSVVRAAHTPEELARSARTPMRSADPRVRFTVRSPRAGAPASDPEEESWPESAAQIPAEDPAPRVSESAAPVASQVEADEAAGSAAPTSGPRAATLGAASLLLAMLAFLALRRARRVR